MHTYTKRRVRTSCYGGETAGMVDVCQWPRAGSTVRMVVVEWHSGGSFVGAAVFRKVVCGVHEQLST